MIIDDEYHAVKMLARMLAEFQELTIVGQFINPIEALEQVKVLQPDIIFVDIEMPGINGLSFADKVLQDNATTEVIFVTAYSEYAVQAFEINALDYILKPATKERLEKSLNRIFSIATNKPEVPSSVEIQCFGGFKVVLGHEQTVKWRTKKAEELFALFITCYPKELTRDKIIEYLWPEVDSEKAIVYFNTTLYNTKKVFSSYGIKDVIVNRNGRYCIREGVLQCDVWQLEKEFASGYRVSAQNVQQIIQHLTELYRDLFFDGYDYNWLTDKQNYVDGLYYDAVFKTTSYLIEHNEIKSAILLLYKVLNRDPLNEAVNTQLITLYIQDHDKASALKVYNAYKNKLQALFDEEPDEEMTKLLQ